MPKLILITGVSPEFGRVMTEHFIQLGHTIVGCTRKEPAIANLQQQFPDPDYFSSVDIANGYLFFYAPSPNLIKVLGWLR